MTIKRYKKPLIITTIIFVIFLLVTFILGFFASGSGFIAFSPIENMGFDSLLILLISWASALIGGILPGYVLAPLLLVVHKYTIGLKMEYGIQERSQSKEFKGSLRGFFPVLMTINFALILSENPVLQEFFVGYTTDFAQGLTFNILISFLLGFSLAAFSAVWFLLDAGIVYTNRNRVKDKTFPVEVRGVGSWLNYLLKGYAGITVIISYYQILAVFISINLGGGSVEISNIIFLITWPLFPIIFTLIIVPIFILIDMTYEHRKRYIQKFAKKIGISGPLEDPLDLDLRDTDKKNRV
ncbi:MAG: hypothetical protein R6W84_08510 [Promethearchaeia archaeon]